MKIREYNIAFLSLTTKKREECEIIIYNVLMRRRYNLIILALTYINIKLLLK